jgi:hypothetical protein
MNGISKKQKKHKTLENVFLQEKKKRRERGDCYV